eukprot:jgi/Bigna1/146792/aug1.121_g21500
MVPLASSAAETRILLQVVDACLRKWRLKPNPSPKTMWMCVGAQPPHRSRTSLLRFCCNGHWPKRTDSHTCLGVIFNSSLDWKEQAASNARKARRALFTMKRMCSTAGEKLSPRAFITVHKATVRPLVERAAAVWSPSLPAHSLRLLEGVQSEAMRWALRAPVRIPAVAIRLELGLPSMASRLQTLTMRFFLKSASFTERLCSSLWGSCFQLDLLPARSIKRLILSVLQSAPPSLLASNSMTE